MNNKGFTLIELLAVLVILTAIMGIALPSITSSMERTKKAQDDKKKKMLESYAEIYVTDHKNAVYKSIEKIAEEVPDNISCYITFEMLSDYLPDDATIDSNGSNMTGYIIFSKPTSTTEAKYQYESGNAESNKRCDKTS